MKNNDTIKGVLGIRYLEKIETMEGG